MPENISINASFTDYCIVTYHLEINKLLNMSSPRKRVRRALDLKQKVDLIKDAYVFNQNPRRSF